MATVIWKEWKEYLAQGGGRRGPLGLLILAVPGVFMPWSFARIWLTSPVPVFIAAYVSLFMVTSIIADSFAGERERHTLETLLASRLPEAAILLGKVAAAVLYAWMFSVASLLIALVTVNVARPGQPNPIYSWQIGVAALVAGLLVALLWSALGVLTSLRAATIRQAQQRLSVAMMVLFFIPVVGVGALPAAFRTRLLRTLASGGGASIAVIAGLGILALDAVLLWVALARFRRPRLIA
ncbi:MAG: ABC transporter permease [Chloroflexota bacterium]